MNQHAEALVNGDYERQLGAWRERMETSLRADQGWLTLAGLYWLEDGANTVGAHPSNAVVFPAGSGPEQVGRFDLHGGRVTFHALPDVHVTINGAPISSLAMQADATGTPTLLTLNALSWQVIQYGDKFAVRVWDRHHAARQYFTGRLWFPLDESYRITARYTPHATPRLLDIATIVDGISERSLNPGHVGFTLQGQAAQLEAITRNGGGLRFIFRDLTSGVSTHPNCRYLDAEPPHNDQVVLDFNMACNLPCAFTPFTVCPLPPPQNRLPMAIEAGERYEAKY
jgi:hypothetical protein